MYCYVLLLFKELQMCVQITSQDHKFDPLCCNFYIFLYFSNFRHIFSTGGPDYIQLPRNLPSIISAT